MALYVYQGQVLDDQAQDIPEGAEPIATYTNRNQYQGQEFAWDPARQVWSGGIEQTSAGYLPMLLQMQEQVRAGTANPLDVDWYNQMVAEARAIPIRDIASLEAGWQPQRAGDEFLGEGEAQWRPQPEWWSRLDPMSPDVGPIMLELRDKLDRGEASEHERSLYDQVRGMAEDWNYRASVPQASDALNPLGDQFFQALSMLGLAVGGAGSFGAFAAAPAAGAGAAAAPAASVLGVPTSTLSTIGTAAGYGSQAAGMFGEALDQPWLSQIAKALSVVGGLSGGLAGAGNVLTGGIESLSEAARLAQSAGRIGGALGTATGFDPLRQASRYLGYAGQAGNVAAGVLPQSFTDWSGDNSPLAANVAPGVQNLLSAATQATQRAGGGMAEGDWLDFETDDWWRGGAAVGANYSSGGSGTLPTTWDQYQAGNYANTTYAPFGAPGGGSLEDQVRQMISQRPDLYGTSVSSGAGGGGGNWWSTLGGLASGALGFLGKNAATLGPLASAIGGGVAANVGSGAARDAGRLQADALNRGIDLQTAQWLQQQANQAPWMEAGRGALGELTWRQGAEDALPMPGATAAISGANYQLPGTTPGWTPQNFDAGAYRWSPGQGPSAANYRYTPGLLPDAAQYASGPPQLYQGAMPGTQVPTLTGQQVLDQDPGAAFRQTEARKALEGSAAARGDLLSGGNLKALQARSQDLASQEYQNAWQRMMGRDVEQYGRNWGQYQQAWNQGVQGTQLGLQTNAQNFGQAMSAAQLREQVMQVASQQGWSQAQTEAAFREQMAQAASQQGFQQGMAGTQWNQGQQQQWQQEQYERMMRDVQTRYGWDTAQNTTDYQRQQQVYQQQLAEQQRQWNQAASLAGIGQTATTQVGNQGAYSTEALGKMYTQLGQAQGQGAVGGAYPWTQAIGTGTNALTNLFKGLNA